MTDRPTVVLFTRDLRLRDHPALAAACRLSSDVVPAFVLDPAILSGRFAAPNRAAFLSDALADLRTNLRGKGGDLVLRAGDPVEEAVRLARETGAVRITVSADVTSYAHRRERRLALECARTGIALTTFPGVTVVPPGELHPVGSDHYRVFTPYWRAWSAATWRGVESTPRRIRLPRGLDVGALPDRQRLADGPISPHLPPGGETAGLARLDAVVRHIARTGQPDRDDLGADDTTRLSAYLHFGCVSPLYVAVRLRGRADDVVRQLCWRDFFHQVTAAFPRIASDDYRPRGHEWTHAAGDAVPAWRDGRTGVPLVDAGMRQLVVEGWLPNRVRMVVASFLTRQLDVDWRVGAAHFFRWLVDGDVANNAGNWQWVAGTGNDTRPGRVLNPVRQGRRFDPDGTYVRRWVPELADVRGAAVHEPWRLPAAERRRINYPPPIVEPVPRRR